MKTLVAASLVVLNVSAFGGDSPRYVHYDPSELEAKVVSFTTNAGFNNQIEIEHQVIQLISTKDNGKVIAEVGFKNLSEKEKKLFPKLSDFDLKKEAEYLNTLLKVAKSNGKLLRLTQRYVYGKFDPVNLTEGQMLVFTDKENVSKAYEITAIPEVLYLNREREKIQLEVQNALDKMTQTKSASDELQSKLNAINSRFEYLSNQAKSNNTELFQTRPDNTLNKSELPTNAGSAKQN